MSEHIDVAVVGAGAMGSAAAWHLARRGLDVALIDQFETPNLVGASHGTSRNFNLLQANSEMIDLALESERWIREIEDSTGTQLLETSGLLVHGPDAPDAAKIEFYRQRGLDVQEVSLREAGERWAGFRVDTRAVWSKDSGRLNLEGLVEALHHATTLLGGVVRSNERVRNLTILDGDHVRLELEHSELVAKKVVVAAGAWTADLLEGVLELPPMRVTQEQPAHFPIKDSADVWPSFMHKRDISSQRYHYWPSNIYGMLTPGQGVKIGWHAVGKEVHPDRRDFLPDAQQLRELCNYAEEWLPGVHFTSPDPMSCTYTTPPDSAFILDRHGPLTVGAGFSGMGAKFTGSIGRILADLATGSAEPSPNFSLRRFTQSDF